MEYNVFQDNKLLDLLKNKTGWVLYKFTELLSDDTKNAVKIKKEAYLESGINPIIDQGKYFIAGYTDEYEGLYNIYPTLIFGDHTRVIKYIDFPMYIGADGVKLLKPVLDEEKLNVKYLYYFLSTIELPNDGYSRHFKYLKEIVIPVPEINNQNKIVEVLDKAQELIDKRKVQIEELDELIKSVFYNMFGDPNLNTKGWKRTNVIDVCDCMVPGRDKPKSFTGNIPWITIDDLVRNGITYKSKSNMGLTVSEIEQVKRKTIPKGSVILSCVGNLGITSIAGRDMIINQQLHSFQCKDEINNFYLSYVLPYYKNEMERMATSTTVLYMNKTVCNSINIILPPIELQNKFANIFNSTYKQKELLQQSLSQLEENFNSLMQKAFTGELFN